MPLQTDVRYLNCSVKICNLFCSYNTKQQLKPQGNSITISGCIYDHCLYFPYCLYDILSYLSNTLCAICYLMYSIYITAACSVKNYYFCCKLFLTFRRVFTYHLQRQDKKKKTDVQFPVEWNLYDFHKPLICHINVKESLL